MKYLVLLVKITLLILTAIGIYQSAYEAGVKKGLQVGVENCDPYLPNYPYNE